MDLASASSMMNAHQPSPAGPRLQRRWLAVAWVGWSILTLFSLTEFITSIHEYLIAAPKREGYQTMTLPIAMRNSP